jgi:phosphinothricin acetyltransferase
MTAPLVRSATRDDLPALLDIYNYYVEHTHHTAGLEPSTHEEFVGWFVQFAETGPYRALVCESKGQVIGYASSREFHPKKIYSRTVEVGLYVAHQHRGSGIGSLLYARLFEGLAAEPGIHQFVAGITLPNDASLVLHTKFGIREVATFEDIAFRDHEYWSLRWTIRLARLDEPSSRGRRSTASKPALPRSRS